MDDIHIVGLFPDYASAYDAGRPRRSARSTMPTCAISSPICTACWTKAPRPRPPRSWAAETHAMTGSLAPRALPRLVRARRPALCRAQAARAAGEGKEDGARLDERRGIASVARPSGPFDVFSRRQRRRIARPAGADPTVARGSGRSVHPRHTGTVTSAAVMADRLPARAIHQFLPLDARAFVRRFLDHWQPDCRGLDGKRAVADADLRDGCLGHPDAVAQRADVEGEP